MQFNQSGLNFWALDGIIRGGSNCGKTRVFSFRMIGDTQKWQASQDRWLLRPLGCGAGLAFHLNRAFSLYFPEVSERGLQIPKNIAVDKPRCSNLKSVTNHVDEYTG